MKKWLNIPESKLPDVGIFCFILGMAMFVLSVLCLTPLFLLYAASALVLLPASIWSRGVCQLIAIATQTVAIFMTVVTLRGEIG